MRYFTVYTLLVAFRFGSAELFIHNGTSNGGIREGKAFWKMLFPVAPATTAAPATGTAQCTETVDQVSITANLTRLITPTTPKTCTFAFPRQAGICQLRLDFLMFNLLQPQNRTVRCITDRMTISGSVTVNTLELCGTMGTYNDHIYLDYGNSNGPINIIIAATEIASIYEIRATQIQCNSELRVPADCLQYHREQSGNVSSFNFPNQQLNNEHYRICIERRLSEQRIQWTACSTTSTEMQMRQMCLIGPICGGGTGSGHTPCFNDYVEIPGSTSGRYCVPPFPLTVTSDDFYIHVHFDDMEPRTAKTDILRDPESGPPEPVCSALDLLEDPGYHAPYFDAELASCVSKPLSKFADIANPGFCLSYTTVSMAAELGDDPPPHYPQY